MARIEFIPIIPSGMKISAYLGEMNAALKDITDEFERGFQGISGVFESGDVKYKKEVDIQAWGDMSFGSTSTDDKRMVYLNEGTKVRHAKLSNDWVSKTTPNQTGVRMGYGKVVAISKQYNGAGIEARNFDKLIAKNKEKYVQKRLDDAMARATLSVFT